MLLTPGIIRVGTNTMNRDNTITSQFGAIWTYVGRGELLNIDDFGRWLVVHLDSNIFVRNSPHLRKFRQRGNKDRTDLPFRRQGFRRTSLSVIR